ncbi:MAG: UTP--glucose-1-phosphate uridylyltransferase [Verrucomicrobia bacterium]|nr:UTP--glucose-1-phosphate uridylyltransferase [Verrucomicrobiota bacterium]
MKIRKAVITAAGPDQRTLPLQTLIDRDGKAKSALRILAEEAAAAGIEECLVITHRGDAEAYREAVGDCRSWVRFQEQSEPLGYGHAAATAKAFVGGEPFLLMVGDHLYLSQTEERCAAQLVRAAEEAGRPVSAVQQTHESKLPYYGAAGGYPVRGKPGWFHIETVAEKPTPTEAEQTLLVPGMRAGYYLCFFGMHALPPAVFELLEEALAKAEDPRRVRLTDALASLVEREGCLAYEVRGRRYDIGVRYGVFTAQLALALAGTDKEFVLAQLADLLAQTLSGRDPRPASPAGAAD